MADGVSSRVSVCRGDPIYIQYLPLLLAALGGISNTTSSSMIEGVGPVVERGRASQALLGGKTESIASEGEKDDLRMELAHREALMPGIDSWLASSRGDRM